MLLPASAGVPNSGKSEWIDALMVNLAIAYGWSFALCSMEKKPRCAGGKRGAELGVMVVGGQG